MGRKNQNADEKPEVAADETAGDERTLAMIGTVEVPCTVPSFTIRPDSQFGIKAMITVVANAIQYLQTDEERRELVAKLREFDLHEELHRKELHIG